MREHSACLLMDEFYSLPSEQEMEGFCFLSINQWSKRLILTMSAEEQVNFFLKVMRKEGERGRLWPGLRGR